MTVSPKILPLSFDEWYESNEQDLSCQAAETGADREADFDSEAYAEKNYEAYLTTLNRNHERSKQTNQDISCIPVEGPRL